MSEHETVTAPQSRFLTSLTSQLENAKAWSFLILLFFASRLVWLYVTRHELSAEIAIAAWLRFFLAGFRIDSVVATYWMLPCLVWAALLCLVPGTAPPLRRFRQVWIAVITVATPILTFMNLGYYATFGNVFDGFLFEFFEGNAQDVLWIAYHDHGLVSKLLLSLLVSGGLFVLYRRGFAQPVELSATSTQLFRRRLPRVACSLVCLVLVVIGLRGTFRSRPTQRTDTSVSRHRVLNLGALNPLYNLKTAFQLRRQHENYFSEDRLVPPTRLDDHLATIGASLDQNVAASSAGAPLTFQHPAWQRTAAGPPTVRPDHVFVLFLESYDSWPFLEKYRELGLVEEGRRLGQEGRILLNYLPGANSSVKSSLVTLQGVYDTYSAQQQCLPTSLVCNFERLGYRTRSINGFVSQWGDAEKSATDQGFDEVYCTEHIKPGGETSNLQLHDRTLFEFAAEQLPYDAPTFNYIRSSSYHGPWEVDLEAEECTVPPFPEAIRTPGMRDETLLRTAYGHLKYTDKVAVAFVRKMSKRFPNSLFVLTGDHYGRNFLTPAPPPYEGASVPLILYGPKVLAGLEFPDNATGGHVDLGPTLLELAAPAGFRYASLGNNLFQRHEQPMAVGEQFVLFPDTIVSLRQPRQCVRLPWLGGERLAPAAAAPRIERAQQLHDAYHGVSYMMARRSLEAAQDVRVAEGRQSPPARPAY